MPLEKLWRVFLCTQQLQAGDAGAHEETHWGGDWTGALRAGGGNAVSPRALLPVLLPLTPLPTVNLPYWGDVLGTHFFWQRSCRAWRVASDDSILYVPCWNPTKIQSLMEGWLCCHFFFYALQKHAFLSLCLSVWPLQFLFSLTKVRHTRDFLFIEEASALPVSEGFVPLFCPNCNRSR